MVGRGSGSLSNPTIEGKHSGEALENIFQLHRLKDSDGTDAAGTIHMGDSLALLQVLREIKSARQCLHRGRKFLDDIARFFFHGRSVLYRRHVWCVCVYTLSLRLSLVRPMDFLLLWGSR